MQSGARSRLIAIVVLITAIPALAAQTSDGPFSPPAAQDNLPQRIAQNGNSEHKAQQAPRRHKDSQASTPQKPKAPPGGAEKAEASAPPTQVQPPLPDAGQEEERPQRFDPRIPEPTLRWFAAVNAVAEEIQERYARQLIDAQDNAQQMQQIYRRMNEEIMSALAASDITMDEYKQVVEAAQQDPGLRARIVAMVKEIRAEIEKERTH